MAYGKWQARLGLEERNITMKCPYKNFEECVMEKCPSCNYEEIKDTIIGGKYPYWMSRDEALKRGNAWKETRTTYKFISCKLIDNSVQPIPQKKEIINNHSRTDISIKRSVF